MKRTGTFRYLFLSFLALIILNGKASLCFCAQKSAPAELNEELFFVGENVRVLTIASRREESPEEAPAVAMVITSQEILSHGWRTLGEVLSTLPGFNLLAQREGSKPYLRGIPNGILFLYDGVPLTSDSTKNIHPLDEELSLEAISRIEVIRGPGSVLWGPDAFAGIVNIVPKKGAEAPGLETGLLLGSPTQDQKVFLNWGINRGFWQSFLSVSAYRRQAFHEKWSFGHNQGDLGWARFGEAVFSFYVPQKFSLSGRISRFKRLYVATDGNISWPAEKKNPFNFLKLEAQKQIGRNSLRFKGYYSFLNQRHKEASLKTRQKNHLLYAEILWERENAEHTGLWTAGLSWRQNLVRKATINIRGFLPEFLQAETSIFSPIVDVADFNTHLFSVFMQYRQRFKQGDFWAGWRLDDHNQYQTTVSYNLGLHYQVFSGLHLKLLHGTAYRTPYSAQFLRRKDDPERIVNFSLDLQWTPRRDFSFSWTGFYNHIKNHVDEDPFGGFSLPSSNKFLGFETSFRWSWKENFLLWGNWTCLSQWGEQERYRVLDYIFLTPEGDWVSSYSEYQKPFDVGAKRFGNLGFLWKGKKHWELSLRWSYLGPRYLSLLSSQQRYRFPGVIIGDLTLSYLFSHQGRLQLALKNFADKKYLIPGPFGPEEGPRWAAYLSLRLHW